MLSKLRQATQDIRSLCPIPILLLIEMRKWIKGPVMGHI